MDKTMETKDREAYRMSNDMNELDKQAEEYLRSVMNNDGDVFTRSDLYEYIKDAWKAGYVLGVTTRSYFLCQDCPKRAMGKLNDPRIVFIPTATARE